MKKLMISLFALGALVIVLFLTTNFFNLTEFFGLIAFLMIFHEGATSYNEGKKKRGVASLVISVSFIIFILTGITF